MTNSSFIRERWLTVRNHFLLDAFILLAGVALASIIRFQDPTPKRLIQYLPAVLAGALSLPSLIYGAGIYSDHVHLHRRYRFLILFFCYAGALIIMLGIGSLSFDSRVGRGVLLFSFPPTLAMLALHHGFIIKKSLGVRERLLVIVSGVQDEHVYHLLERMSPPFLELAGTMDTRNTGTAANDLKDKIGDRTSDLAVLIGRLNLHSILCTAEQLREPKLGEMLRSAAFSGIRLVTLTDVMEEAFRLVPSSLITPEWLLMASTMAHRTYIKKRKRLFDVGAALTVGLLVLPVFVLGMAWVKIADPQGPVFFRQVRRGRFGRNFLLVKLRTMRVDAEPEGPQWAKKQDSRVIPGGQWLRKFRIDEIPQLLNILRGEMSFVGPRPERPEFEVQLTAEIPYFRERLHVAPGLTGWAQVRYPYGASIEDARRKLEYDLYYMKYMNLTLDLFILLDTVRIVLGGGATSNNRIERCMNEFTRQPLAGNSDAEFIASSTKELA